MTNSCPICGTSLESAVPTCPGCGFPTALAREAERALAETAGGSAPTSTRPSGTSSAVLRPPEATRRAADPQVEVCDRSAREIRGDLAVFIQLGGDVGSVMTEMGQAALVQADGRTAEAADLLRGVQQHIASETNDLFVRRVGDLEFRQQALLKEGVGVDFGVDITWMRKEFEAGRRSSALSLLQIVDHKLSRMESDWRGLRGLLRQIDALRQAAGSIGEEPPKVRETLDGIREILSRSPVDSNALDTVAQSAAEALMMLHETLPTIIHQELDRDGLLLGKRTTEDEATVAARALLAETSRDLRKGQLIDACRHLGQLRTAMKPLEVPEPAAAKPAEAEPSGLTSGPLPAPAESEADQLSRLLKQARELAGRVRSLPPDSEISFEAASEIRRATELLRASRLDEAELTLSRLMRTLDSERLRKA